MILSEAADQTTLRTNSQSRLIVSLMLMWTPLLLFLLAVPGGFVLLSLVVAVAGGLTYSKRFIFDRATQTLIARTQIYGINREKKLKFEEIVGAKAISRFWRKGTDVVVELKNRKKLLVDRTSDTEYVERVVGAINRLFEK